MNLTFILILLTLSMAIVNHKVTRTVNLDGNTVSSLSTIVIENNEDPGLVKNYLIALNASTYPDLINLKVTQDDTSLTFEEAPLFDAKPSNMKAFNVKLDVPIKLDASTTIVVEEIYANRKIPFPRKMKLTETPKYRIFDDAYYQTFYPTKSMKSTF